MANNIFNRLQLVRGLNPLKENGVFDSREDAYNYILDYQMRGDYPSISDPTKNRPSLLGEPIVLLYESGSSKRGPNVILAIGSVGDGKTASNSNRTFFIDTQKTEEEIEELNIKIEELEKLINIIPIDSKTLDLSVEQTQDGTIISGDVKIADYKITSGKVEDNIIVTEGEKGIYTFVDMDYNPDTCVIKFRTTKTSKEFQLPKDQHVEKGWYDPKEESIFVKLADGTQIKILVTKLIEEWTVLPDGRTIRDYNVSGQTVNYTPIALYKTHVGAKETEHEGVYEWQDVLEADIKVADHISDNILHKDKTGRYLYVKGTADNIQYKNGYTVSEALDKIDTRVSTSAGNIIYKRPDGIYATAMVGYNASENKLTYAYSDGNTGELKTVEFQLNSAKLIDDITYDPVNEVIVIRYIDAQGEYKRVEIPAKDIIEEWIVNNEAHNIYLNKYRSQGAGKDILSADAKIHAGDNNILEDLNHELYVNGVSSNIKYDVTGNTTVKDVLDRLSGATDGIQDEIDRIDATIGSGFTSDPHENITSRFEKLNEKIESEIERSTEKDNELEAKIDAEIERSTEKDTEHDGKIQAIEDEIGDGFGPRNTVRDEIDNLQGEIDSLSAETANKLADIDSDNSINIDKTNPTVPVISVNLSEEPEQGRPNIIKLNNDGIYAGVDLAYEEAANKLIFTTTNGSKEIQLDSMSSIINIEYNPTKEAIVITYMTNGHEIKTVEIPVGDLINEWRVEDGHPHAVQLEKVRVASGTSEQDILKASVIITDDHDDNILVMDDGALYVSGAQIEQNKQDIADLKDRMDTAEDDIDTLEDGLAREIERSTQKDAEHDELISNLRSDLNDEVTRATAVENELRDALSAETNARIAEDSRLDTKIDNEISRATTAEENLAHLIEDEAERRASGDTRLSEKIDTEEARARETEQRLETAINNEISRAQTRENELNTAITNETIRAQAADNELYQKIADETSERASKDAELESLINQETARAQVAENSISERLSSEIERSTTEDERLSNAISAETAAREAGDAEIAEAIRAAKLTFSPSLEGLDSDGTIMFNDYTTDSNIVKAKVMLQDGDNIIKVGNGLYATASLEYEPTGNKLRLVTSNGAQEYIQLVGATLLDSIEYDPNEKILKIFYTDGTGSQRYVDVGVTDLWNEWIIQNPSEKSAVELTKVIGDPGNPDELSGRVLITDDRNGDGKPDEGSDNIIEIRNNGLYVDGSEIIEAKKIAECAKNELKSVEKATFGYVVSEECGSGFTYTPYVGACIISGATSLYDADKLLNDQLCELLNMWVSGETCTTKSEWVEDGANKKVEVHAKLSMGNTAAMTQDDTVIENLSGDYVDPTGTEFTDTNALRIVCLQDGGSGVTPSVTSKQNGIYLSNHWDCGLYYNEETEAEEIAKAQAAGYKTDNYRTDISPDTYNYNYMNNVRQNDPIN